ncbi:hypothetical protein BDFB_005805 [Asbolus verrucosus]|uniref:Uncharacterized protein n=1 Tax=Asbolus verrucosus TaxID=1661398 RepID=A0A482VH27_ASBVE|nr:hypothetical protein BDFB_005805 [Asbolus verrucosus]
MQKICQISRLFELGNISTKLWENRRVIKTSRRHLSARGPLPWENCEKFSDQPQKIFRKKEPKCNEQPVEEKICPEDCEILQKPKRNAYEWVIEDEKPCKPFNVRSLLDKTLCEIRRFQKCMRIFRNECNCQNLAPDCSKTRKVYPMMEAFQKGSLPGCARPLRPPAPQPTVEVNKTEKKEAVKK